MDGPGDHSHVFIARMHMGRHLITGGQFEPVYEGALLGRITEEHGHLGPLRESRRRGAHCMLLGDVTTASSAAIAVSGSSVTNPPTIRNGARLMKVLPLFGSSTPPASAK